MKKKLLTLQSRIDDFELITYGLLIAFLLLFASSNTYQVSTAFWTSNSFISQTNTVFVSATRTLFNIQYRFLLLFILIILFVGSLVSIYEKYTLKKNTINLNFLKTLIIYLPYVFIIFLVCLLSGLQDLASLFIVLLLSAGFVFVASNRGIFKNGQKKLCVLIVLGLLPWILVLIYSLGTIVYGSIRSTGYVYVEDLIALIYFIFIVWLHTERKQKKGSLISTLNEFIPTINLLLVTTFSLVLIIGLHNVS